MCRNAIIIYIFKIHVKNNIQKLEYIKNIIQIFFMFIIMYRIEQNTKKKCKLETYFEWYKINII